MRILRRPDPAEVTGLSLLEALTTLGLMALALGLIGLAASQYSRLLSRHDQAALATAQLQMLTGLSEELAEATAIYSPASPGDAAEVLEYSLIDPLANRLVLPAPPAPLFNPTNPAHTLRVRLYHEEEQLLRQVTFPDGQRSRFPLARSVAGFSVRRLAEDELILAATFLAGEQLHVSTQRVCWWPGRDWP